jgi:hypothetical protein
MNNLIIFPEEYRLWNSLLCSFFHPLVTYSILGLNVPSARRSQISSFAGTKYMCLITIYLRGEYIYCYLEIVSKNMKRKKICKRIHYHVRFQLP